MPVTGVGSQGGIAAGGAAPLGGAAAGPAGGGARRRGPPPPAGGVGGPAALCGIRRRLGCLCLRRNLREVRRSVGGAPGLATRWSDDWASPRPSLDGRTRAVPLVCSTQVGWLSVSPRPHRNADPQSPD